MFNKFSIKIFGENKKNFVRKSFSFESFYFYLCENLHKNDFPATENIFKEITSRSFLSLKQTYEIINKAYYNNLSYEDCHDLDMEKTKENFDTKELFEGIRAYFIEKDNNPKWKFQKISDLTFKL